MHAIGCGSQVARLHLMNLLMVFSAGLASMLVGMVWYAPIVAGNMWHRLSGAENGLKVYRGVTLPLAAHFACSLVLAFLLARSKLDDILIYQLVIMMWVVFSIAMRLPQFLLEGRSMKLFVIYAVHDLLTLMTIGTVIVLWR